MIIDLMSPGTIPIWNSFPHKASQLVQKATLFSEDITIRIRATKPDNLSLFIGDGARALYFATRYEWLQEKRDLEEVQLWVHKCKNILLSANKNYSLDYYGGLTGMLYLMRYLAKKKVIAALSQELFAQYEEHLFKHASKLIEQNENDFLYGSFGILRYFIVYHKTGNNKRYATSLLHKVVSHLKGYHPVFYVNSLSIPIEKVRPGMNGQCSFLLVLLEAVENGILATKCFEAIHKGIDYLMRFKEDLHISKGRYFFLPQYVNTSTNAKTFDSDPHYYLPDLNLSLLLHRCSIAFDNSDYHCLATTFANNTLMRLTTAPYNCAGAALTNGAAGIAQFYKTLYDSHPASSYLHGYYLWIQNTLHFLEHPDNDESLAWDEIAIPNGLCGTGLVLLSFIRENIRDWGKVLLL